MLSRRVEAGMTWLNTHYPGWRTTIDLDWLAMGSCTACIPGQLGGTYHTVVNAFDLDEWDVLTLGFDIDCFSCDLLTDAWRTALAPVR